MRKSKLESPQLKLEVLERVFWGENQRAIAKRLDVSPSTICRFLKREDTQLLMESYHFLLLQSCLKRAAENIISLVNGYQTTIDPIKREHGFQASMKIFELAMGLK
jgi:hypothetical protein